MKKLALPTKQEDNISEVSSRVVREKRPPPVFGVEKLEKVNKVPDCAYVNEGKEKVVYYLCPCSEEYSPICQACKEKCHASHNPTLTVSGINECSCGKGNHVVKKLTGKSQNPCFYSKFCEITPSKAPKVYEGKLYCPVCFTYCLGEPDTKKKQEKKEEEVEHLIIPEVEDTQKKLEGLSLIIPELKFGLNQSHSMEIEEFDNLVYDNFENKEQCVCTKGHDCNVIALNEDLKGKKGFHEYLRNFNVNILFKVQKTKQLYIQPLTDQIKTFIQKKTAAQNFEFFANFLNFKILELFSCFSQHWKNKYISPVLFLYNFKLEDLVELMSIPKEMHLPDPQVAKSFYSAKLYFAELLFNYYIKSHIQNHNNIYSMKTILNMTIGQRCNFLMHAKEFYKFVNVRDNDIENTVPEKIINFLSSQILDLFYGIIKQSDQYEWRIINDAFTSFNRIMKYLIKFNLINDEEKNRYFDIIIDSLHLFIRKKTENADIKLHDTALYLVKSLVYASVYLNDKKCYGYITGQKSNDKFFFQVSDYTVKLCRIFLIVFPDFFRFADVKKSIAFDYCVQKFFELGIFKEDFYRYSIDNLDKDDINLILNYFQHPYDYHEHFLGDVVENKKLYDVVSTLSEEIGIQNKNYFQYELTQEIYTRGVAILISNFSNYIDKFQKQIVYESLKAQSHQIAANAGPNKSKKVEPIKESDITDLKKKIKVEFYKELRQVLMCTNFLQKIDEFLYIYSKGQEYKGNEYDIGNNRKSDLQSIINFLISLFKNLIKDDMKVLILISNFNAENFVNSLVIGNKDKFFKLLNYMNDLIVKNSKNLNRDAFDFLNRVIRMLIHRKGNDLSYLAEIMKLTGKSVRVVMEKNPNFGALIEFYNDLFESLKKNPMVSEFFNKNENTSVAIQFFEAYFNFMSELMVQDLFIFDIQQNELVPLSVVEKCVVGYLNRVVNYESPEFEYALFRYFFLKKISLGFSSKTINTQMKNLLNRDINSDYDVSLLKLMERDPKENEDKQNYLIVDLLETAKILRRVIRLFVCETFNNIILNYYENVILRPLYTLINYFVLYSESIKGSDCYIIYESVFYFYHITTKIFNGERRNIGYNEVCVKSNLTEKEIKTINEELAKLTEKPVDEESAIKYYQLPKIYESFMKVVGLLLKIKTDDKPDSPKPTIKQEDNDNPFKNLLYTKYQSKKEKDYDESLVLIKTLNILVTETGNPYRMEVLQYFLCKLFDPLTENYLYPSYIKNYFNQISKDNYRFEDENKKMVIKQYTPNADVSFAKGKFQNAYALYFLNALFFNNSSEFQSDLFTFFANNRLPMTGGLEELITYLIKHIVFTSILAEVERRYTIDYISENNYIGRNKNATFQIAKAALKFIQNTCEGHNTKYQNLLFASFFKEDNYSLKCPKVSKENENENEKENEKKTSEYEGFKADMGENDDNVRNKYDYSFSNFLFYNMEIIMENLHSESDFKRSIFENMRTNNNDNLIELYTSITDLIIEMLQGTDPKNFHFIFSEPHLLKDDYYFEKKNAIETVMSQERLPKSYLEERRKKKSRKYFQFMTFAEQIAHKIFIGTSFIGLEKSMNNSLTKTGSIFENESTNELFNPLSYEMKFREFCMINSVISQDNIPKPIISLLNQLFPASKLINVVSNLLCKIYLDKIVDDQGSDPCNFSLNEDKLNELFYAFKNNNGVYEDENFQLASQMVLFLTIMAEKYTIKEAIKVINLKNEPIEPTILLPKDEPIINQDGTTQFRTEQVSTEDILITENNEKIRIRNNNVVACKFFTEIIKKVEFKTESSKNAPLVLKTIYFIIDPAFYSISNNSIDQFQNNVDRSSSTTKIRALIDALDLFMAEVENKKGFEVDFRKGVNLNFWVSLAINVILLFFLNGNGNNQLFLWILTSFLIFGQVAANIYLVFKFLFTKYNFYVEIEKKKYDKKKITLYNYVQIYILDSFLINDEISLINYLIILGTFGIFFKYNLFCFVLQLLTVINFVDTIKEIVLAFKMRFNQLFFMICFLAILIFFYANLGFYFYIDEFDTVINGTTENFCQTLLECTITYFNHGVRAGGGIGDIIGDKTFDNMSAYYTRWFTDIIFYITVILLLLNMINGVIVSTFSQIRESGQQKTDDINNKCFICNIERKIFEKKKIDFIKHQEEEHNLIHYIMFFIYLKRICEKDLDADQSFIVQCLKEHDNRCFPLKQSKSIGIVEDESDEEEED